MDMLTIIVIAAVFLIGWIFDRIDPVTGGVQSRQPATTSSPAVGVALFAVLLVVLVLHGKWFPLDSFQIHDPGDNPYTVQGH